MLQHEIDHLDGILFIDRLDKVARDRLKRQIKREGFPAETAAAARGQTVTSETIGRRTARGELV